MSYSPHASLHIGTNFFSFNDLIKIVAKKMEQAVLTLYDNLQVHFYYFYHQTSSKAIIFLVHIIYAWLCAK